ncbi:type II secretion system protein GspC [Persephonella sp.]
MDKILIKLDLEKIFLMVAVICAGVSLAYIINSYLESRFFSLPPVKQEPVNLPDKKTDKKSYANLKYIFMQERTAIQPSEEKETTSNKTRQSVEMVTNLKLIGIINAKKKKLAFIKSGKIVKLVGINEIIDGYKLKEIKDFYLILEKNGKKYMLSMDMGFVSAKTSNILKKKEEKKSVQTESEVIRIDRRFVKEKTADIGTLLKDVLIVPEIRNNETVGFRFRYVKPQSILYKFGLRSGDLIISINDMPVRTAEEAFKIYNMLRNEELIKLVIERNGKRKVITYEIR